MNTEQLAQYLAQLARSQQPSIRTTGNKLVIQQPGQAEIRLDRFRSSPNQSQVTRFR